MKQYNKSHHNGFTIVELLIVIVVIGILAAITIVAYNGVQERAKISSLNSSLNQAAKKIAVWQIDNPDSSPTSLDDVGIIDTNTINYQYSPSGSGNTYCVTATTQATSYYISNSSGGPKQGVCSGFNLLAWNKTSALNNGPVPTMPIDTSVFRTSTASVRLGPNTPGQGVRNSPYSGTIGQIYTLSFWIKTDATWNGTVNNSKIRFGTIGGGPLTTCSYNGVKTNWTFFTCSHTLVAGDTQVHISVGNDGTTGNIWLDDIALTKS